MLAIALKLAELFLPFLTPIIQAVAIRIGGSKMDAVKFMKMCGPITEQIVTQTEKEHPDWDGEAKKAAAFKKLSEYLVKFDFRPSEINSMIESAVVSMNLKAAPK